MFNFLELCFFISLGITFLLILLLIYHFKQRIINIELRTDKMFEIVNNLVNEIQHNNCNHNHNNEPEICKIDFEESLENNNDNTINIVFNKLNKNDDNKKKYDNDDSEFEKNDDDDVEYDDDDDDDDDDDNDNDDEDDNDDDDDDDDAADDDDDKCNNYLSIMKTSPENFSLNIEKITVPEFNLDKNELNAPELLAELDEDVHKIKYNDIINEQVFHVHEIIAEDVVEDAIEEIISSATEPETNYDETDRALDAKLSLIPNESSSSSLESTKKDLYKKMSIHELKLMAMSLGITQDINKLKKQELVKVLSNHS